MDKWTEVRFHPLFIDNKLLQDTEDTSPTQLCFTIFSLAHVIGNPRTHMHTFARQIHRRMCTKMMNEEERLKMEIQILSEGV